MYPLLPMNNSTTESDVQHEDYWCPLLTSGVKLLRAFIEEHHLSSQIGYNERLADILDDILQELTCSSFKTEDYLFPV